MIPPQSLLQRSVGTEMPEFDWRSSAAYDRAQDAELTGLAWECLRRNESFEQDHQNAPSQDAPVTEEFRTRWGLCFRG